MLTRCLLVALVAGAAARSSMPRPAVGTSAATLRRLRGGAGEPSDALLQATFACNRLYARVLAETLSEVATLRKAIGAGEAVPAFGEKADAVLADATAKFEAEMPEGDAEVTGLYKDKAQELSDMITTSLEPLFASQIGLLREGACCSPPKGVGAEGPVGGGRNASLPTCGGLSSILPHPARLFPAQGTASPLRATLDSPP